MPQFSQIGRFCLGGGAGVLAYYAAFTFLTEIIGFWYITSAILAWVLNYGINFMIQKFWTFHNMDYQKTHHQLVLYFGMAFGNLLLNTLLLYVFVEWGNIPYLWAQVILTITLSAASYVITRQIFANPAT